MEKEWEIIELLLQVFDTVGLSLRPVTDIPFQAINGLMEVFREPLTSGVREGGPLRVVLRFLLDFIDNIIDDEGK